MEIHRIFAPGTVLEDRYRIVAPIGVGGMGVVYHAEHLGLARPCALKVLRPELAASPEHVERFIFEARAASRCAHPNIVELLDASFNNINGIYCAMELLTGEDLAATLRAEGRLPWPRVRHIALQICDALAAVHASGIVHRDLKPANIFRITRVGDADFVKVLDFGVAKLLGATPGLTGPGEWVGTPCYMAPEQVDGGPTDHRADIYALGAILYHLLTGRTAVAGDSVVAIIHALLTREPEPFTGEFPDLSADMWNVVARAMARDPADRFSSMQAFAAAIAAVDDRTYPASRPTTGGGRPAPRRPTNNHARPNHPMRHKWPLWLQRLHEEFVAPKLLRMIVMTVSTSFFLSLAFAVLMSIAVYFGGRPPVDAGPAKTHREAVQRPSLEPPKPDPQPRPDPCAEFEALSSSAGMYYVDEDGCQRPLSEPGHLDQEPPAGASGARAGHAPPRRGGA